MTAMETAMVNAGIKPPSAKQRVWQAIKESGTQGSTHNALKRRLSAMSESSISVALCELYNRAMVYREKVPAHPGKLGSTTVWNYKTDMERYELLPPPGVVRKDPKKIKRRPAKTVSSPPKVMAMPGPITYVGPEPTKAVPSLDDLTIAEARALYLKLHKMFG